MTANEEPVASEPIAQEPLGEASIPETESKRKIPKWIAFVAVGVLIVALVGIVAAPLGAMLIKPPQKALCEGDAPDWSLTLFPEYKGGVQGDTLTLADLKGKGVVMNFWASWCGPCEQEAAELEAAWQKYKDKGIVFVGVDYLDQEPAAKKYLEKFNITYPNGPDLASKVSKRYTIRGVPETFFIDPQGKLVGCRKIGPFTGDGELERRIAEIMPQP